MRHSTITIVTGFVGLAAGAAVAVMPVVLLEWVVASSGLSEMLPMAAPPLGMTFRALASGAAAIVAMGATVMVLPAAKTNSGQRKKHMAFAFSKLADFARGRNRTGGEEMPCMRRADAHPDAPPRLPLYASRDLGEPALMPIVMGHSPEDDETFSSVTEAMASNAEALDMPRAPEPLPWEAIKAEIARVRGGDERGDGEMLSPLGEKDDTPAAFTQSLEDMTITGLAARFEAGLQRRRASQTALAHAEPVEEFDASSLPTVATLVRQEEPDTDLMAALATLRGITAKAG